MAGCRAIYKVVRAKASTLVMVMVVVVVVMASSGCAVEPAPPPTRYAEDFAGAPTPYQMLAQVSDGQIALKLVPGRCRRIAYTTGLPPRVVNEYACPYAAANVRVGFISPGLGAWAGPTGPDGGVLFLVRDDVALGIGADDVATLFINSQPVGQVSTAPLAMAAISRARPIAAPPIQPEPTPVPVTRPSRAEPAPSPSGKRKWTPEDIFVLTMGVCGAKLWTMDKCGENMGAALCSAGEQWLGSGTVDPAKVREDVAKDKLAADSDFLKALFALADLVDCFGEFQPKLANAAAAGEL